MALRSWANEVSLPNLMCNLPADWAVIMFQATSSVGTMFSGYLQAGVHAGASSHSCFLD
jgi:hypothetical protein